MPEHITKWNFASDDWECPSATNDVIPGGRFCWKMAAKDWGAGFDFEGMYTDMWKYDYLMYTITDGRKVSVRFEPTPMGTLVRESFDMENVNSEEMQRAGWQAILDNFKKYAETVK